MKIDGKEYVTAKEAAEIIDVTAAQVRHLKKSGVLEGIKLGNMNLLTVESVRAYAKDKPKSGWPAGKTRSED